MLMLVKPATVEVLSSRFLKKLLDQHCFRTFQERDMKIELFFIDAFTDKVFNGNPAAVCPLDSWLPDALMQQIAEENNQPATAFFVRNESLFDIRWFTPQVEVSLCGHATLAAAYVIFEFQRFPGPIIEFGSCGGVLRAMRDGGFITLDLPADRPIPVSAPVGLIEGMESKPIEIYKGKTDYMLVYSTPDEIVSLKPEMEKIAELDARGLIVTAPGQEVDFVSRFFAPQIGINEDQASGSAHTTLTPYWALRLRRAELSARQLSKRGGSLWCCLAGERVEISGQARAYMFGQINLD